jgi:hypothetical protein
MWKGNACPVPGKSGTAARYLSPGAEKLQIKNLGFFAHCAAKHWALRAAGSPRSLRRSAVSFSRQLSVGDQLAAIGETSTICCRCCFGKRLSSGCLLPWKAVLYWNLSALTRLDSSAPSGQVYVAARSGLRGRQSPNKDHALSRRHFAAREDRRVGAQEP